MSRMLEFPELHFSHTVRLVAFGVMLVCGISVASATKCAAQDRSSLDNATLVIAHKTNAKAFVSAQYRDQFQKYVNALEAEGAVINFMRGYRGSCSIPRHKHGCGLALDVCQIARGKVTKGCNLPSPKRAAELAAESGLVEAGVWCNSDYGHVEVPTARQAWGCRGNIMAAIAEWKKQRSAMASAAAAASD